MNYMMRKQVNESILLLKDSNLWAHCVLCGLSHSCSCALHGPSGQRELFSLYNSVLLQHSHQDVRGVHVLWLRREQQQLRLEAELHGRVR